MNNTHKTIMLLVATAVYALGTGTMQAMDSRRPAPPKLEDTKKANEASSSDALWKLGKCFAVWGATGVVVGGAYWLNNQTALGEDAHHLISDAIMDNMVFAASLSGLLAGIDVVADEDVKTVTEQTILRVPVIMAVQRLASSEWIHSALRNYSPVLKDVLVCSDDNAHDNHECALKAATLGTLLYVTAIRPGLDKAWSYGKGKAWEVKNWALGSEE